MKALTHTLQSKVNWDRILFATLKDHADEPAMRRVENVLSLLVAADTHAREQLRFYHRSENRDWGKSGIPGFIKESLRVYYRTLEMLNAALRRYRWGAQVKGGTGGFLTQLLPMTKAKNRWAVWESVTVGMLLDLVRQPGELSRFRRCSECQQWFYAIRGHQQFCGEACRRRHAAQDPVFKEKRATYMREIYRPIIQPEKEAREAGQVSSEKSKKGGK